MAIEPMRGVLEEIDRRDCMELIASERIGRLAVVVEGRPEIFPVNYTLDDAGAVVIETAPGLKLTAAFYGYVAFEVDRTESNGGDSGRGWSVVVHGVAHETDPDRLRFAGPHGRSWLEGRSRTIRIQPTTVTGRRLVGARSG